jgi:hypothetical protein
MRPNSDGEGLATIAEEIGAEVIRGIVTSAGREGSLDAAEMPCGRW